MEKLQVPRQLHPLQVDPLSGSKSIPQGESFDQVPSFSEARKVVEMPARASQKELVSDAEINRAPRKRNSKPGNKRKESALGTQSKSTQALRYIREAGEVLSVEEVKRLEAYADRINQLLQERVSRQQFAYESHSIRSGERSGKVADAFYRRPNAPNHRMEVSDGALESEDTETLIEKAELVRQLLAEMTATLEEHQAQPSHLNSNPAFSSSTRSVSFPVTGSTSYRPLNAYSNQVNPSSFPAPTIPSSPTGVPQQDWHYAEQEAEKTAEVLRQLNGREAFEAVRSRHQPGRRSTPRFHRLRLKLQQLFQVPTQPIDRVGDAMLWVVLSAVVRVGARLLTAAHPGLGLLALIVTLTPAAIALFLAFSAPKAGVISFYRLFLIMLGLVIGGKLM